MVFDRVARVGGAGWTFDYDDLGAEPLGPEDPRKLGAIDLSAVLGSGGMGRVYLGVTPAGYVAVKRVLPELANDKGFIRRFRHELDNQARLPDGVGARLLAADYTARPPWFATEYVPGVTVHEAVDLAGGRLPAETCWLLLRELATRLAAMGRLGITHRDLKPSNVMLTRDGVRLIDFGVARAIDQSTVTLTGMVVGTPSYMPPEQANATKSPTPAVDVFSLGSVITFAATGEPPFGRGGPDVFYRIVHTEPDLAELAEVDAALAGVVASCLAKDPAKRPPADAVVEFAEDRTPAGPPVWPAEIASPIEIRSSFAASPRAVDDLEAAVAPVAGAPGTPGAAGTPEVPGTPGAAGTPDTEPVAMDSLGSKTGEPTERQKRMRRAALIALPLVVAAAAGIVVLLLPSSSHPPSDPNTTGQAIRQPSEAVSATLGSSRGKRRHHPGDPGSGGPGPSSSASSHATSSASPHPHPSSPSPSPHPSHTPGRRPVVSSTYSMIKNVAAGQCVTNDGSTVADTTACNASSDQGWEVQNRSGSEFQLGGSGVCLFDEQDSYVGTIGCSGYGSSTGGFWRLGAGNSLGGLLVNTTTGKCLAWVNSYGYNLTTETCNEGNTGQLWYDGGRA